MSTEHGQSTENGARSTESTDVGPVRAPKMTQAATRSPERMREIALAREAAKRARRAAKLTSPETRTIVQVEPEPVAATTTPPPSTSPQGVASGPVAVADSSPVSPAPEKPRDPEVLWQLGLLPDACHPTLCTAPFPVTRRRGRLWVTRATAPGAFVEEIAGGVYQDESGRVYQDREPEGWVPRVPESSDPFEPGLSTSDSYGRNDDGREVRPSRSTAMLKGWVSAQSQANFQHRMDHGT